MDRPLISSFAASSATRAPRSGQGTLKPGTRGLALATTGVLARCSRGRRRLREKPCSNESAQDALEHSRRFSHPGRWTGHAGFYYDLLLATSRPVLRHNRSKQGAPCQRKPLETKHLFNNRKSLATFKHLIGKGRRSPTPGTCEHASAEMCVRVCCFCFCIFLVC